MNYTKEKKNTREIAESQDQDYPMKQTNDYVAFNRGWWVFQGKRLLTWQR